MGRLMLVLPSLAGGGAERVMVELAKGFAARGHDTALVVGTAQGPLRADVPSSVDLVDLGRPRMSQAWLPLARELRRRRPDGWLSAMTHTNVVALIAHAAARSRANALVSEHNAIGERIRLARGWRHKLQYQLAARMYRWGRVVAVSRGVADDVSAHLGMPREQVSVIYNPVRVPPPPPEGPSPHPWLDGTVEVVLGVGRLTPQKGFDRLLRAFVLVRAQRDARLVILGEGPDRESLGALAAALGVEEHVLFPGFVRNAPAWMARASAFALSSRFEGLPTVLVEALAVGAPIASFDCPWGPAEILDQGRYGQLARPDDPASLAEAIVAALGEGRSPEAIAARLARAADFSADKAVDAYLQLLLERA